MGKNFGGKNLKIAGKRNRVEKPTTLQELQNMTSLAEQKTMDDQFSPSLPGKNDGSALYYNDFYKKQDEKGRWRWYMRRDEGDLGISGVSMALRKTNKDTGKRQVRVGIENRVALTKAEQEEIGSAQPYLLPDGDLLDKDGMVIQDIKVGRIIYDRMNNGELNTLDPLESQKITDLARERGRRWWSRHFRHAIWREGLKGSDVSIIEALERLLREEGGRKFKPGIRPNKYSMIYMRPGGRSGQVVFVIDYEDTTVDMDVLRMKGLCNWFSPKKCPAICDNDYFETGEYIFMSEELAEKYLTEYGDEMEGLGCDLSRWGAKDFFDAMREDIFKE